MITAFTVSSDMISIVLGSLVLSVLHALIPNHWLPVLAIGRKENWSLNETTSVTFISGLSHAMSTVLIGLLIGMLGMKMAAQMERFTNLIAPAILILLGIFYIYQHHRHKHFHLHPAPKARSKHRIIAMLVLAMFLSPCFEVEAYFLMAGAYGWSHVILLTVLYTVVTVAGMVVWIRLTYRGLFRMNWHALEHNAGIITGATLIATGILSFFLR